jgi:hypothetical protein
VRAFDEESMGLDVSALYISAYLTHPIKGNGIGGGKLCRSHAIDLDIKLKGNGLSFL